MEGHGLISDYGFSEAEVFTRTGLNDPVQENDKVSYEVSNGQKGPTATNVNVI